MAGVRVLTVQHGIKDGGEHHLWSHILGEELQSIQLRQQVSFNHMRDQILDVRSVSVKLPEHLAVTVFLWTAA